MNGRVGRSRLPRVLLSDTITVARYVSWGVWEPAVTLRCLLDERSTSVQGDGTITTAMVRAYVPPDVRIPAGSKVTLPDGRTGYVVSSIGRGLSSPLPVPAHWEVEIRVGEIAPSPMGGRRITVRRRVVTGRDAYGNDTYTTTPVTYAGVVIGPVTASGEADPTNNRIHRTCVAVFPPGAVVAPGDKVFVDSYAWGVDAPGQALTEPTLGLTAGVLVTLSRTTG